MATTTPHPVQTELANDIVDDVLNDLLGRSGVGNTLEDLKYGDEQTWNELNQTLRTVVSKRLGDTVLF